MVMTPIEAMAALLLVLLSVFSISHGEIIDLSHPQTPDTFYYHGFVPYNRTYIYASDSGGVYYDTAVITSPEHSGTHMDAPSHFVKGGISLDKIPVDWTIADGVTIDCRREAQEDRNYLASVEKITEWERHNGRIPQQAAILFFFGWSSRWNNRTDYLGSTNHEDYTSYRIPSVSEEAGQWLLDNRDLKIIGVDTLSPDPFTSAYPNHVLWCGKNKLIVENLKIPNHMPARGFRFHATPVKYQGSSGTQVRAFAVMSQYEEDVRDSACAVKLSFTVCIGILLATLFTL